MTIKARHTQAKVDPGGPRVMPRTYFASLRNPPKPELVGPYAILHLAYVLAWPLREVSVGSLYEHAPRAAVDDAIARLKSSGLVRTDGVTFNILRMPGEDESNGR